LKLEAYSVIEYDAACSMRYFSKLCMFTVLQCQHFVQMFQAAYRNWISSVALLYISTLFLQWKCKVVNWNIL